MHFKFLSVKEVPTLFWSAPKALTFKPPLTSFVFLVVGLFIFGVGEALIVAAAVGGEPVDGVGARRSAKHRLGTWLHHFCGQHSGAYLLGAIAAKPGHWHHLKRCDYRAGIQLFAAVFARVRQFGI